MVDGDTGAATFAYHVGAHKTGTSLLQEYLAEHRPVLREQRILYLARGVAELIARAGEDPETADEARRQLRKFRRRQTSYDVFVASYENALGPPFARAGKRRRLYPSSGPRIARLGTSLRPFRAKIMLSVRPTDEFVESYYLQFVQQGGCLDFTEWLDRFVDLDQLSWRPLIDDLVSAFGSDAVEVVDFRILKTAGVQGYLRELLNRIVPGAALDVGARAVRNASISDKGLRLALAANPHLLGRHEQIAMRRFLQARFSNTDYARPKLLSDDQKKWLHDRYSHEYDELFAVRAAPAQDPSTRSDEPAG